MPQPWVFGGLATLTCRWPLGGTASLATLVQQSKTPASTEDVSAVLAYTAQSLVTFFQALQNHFYLLFKAAAPESTRPY